MGRFLAATVLIIAGTFAGATTDRAAARPPWFVVEDQLPFVPLPGARALWGVHAGAGYRVEVPDAWNGDVVLYAHGYRGEGPELTVSNPPIRSHLIAEGYAWAASSYRANGYVPGTGAQDTHRLLQRFGSLVGPPDRVYLIGQSMGGHVTGVAIEQWPRSFDGAQPECGVMGDNELFDFYQDAYLVAETVAGNVPDVPTATDYFTSPDGWAATRAALGSSFPTGLTAAGERYKAIVEQLTGGERPTFDSGFAGPFGGAFAFNFGVAMTGPGRDNVGIVYQFDSDPAISAEEAAFNEQIVRIAADPRYRHRNGLGRLPGSDVVSPPISGDISIPVLSTHTLGELFVPFHMQQIYARRVADHGQADLLVTRAIRDISHCSLSSPERIAAFDDLVAWVETGVRPAGDEVLDPDAVADDQFGCQFTVPDRSFLPACEP
jgi:pimeloyl-ACP methyl ester carboxylesterase